MSLKITIPKPCHENWNGMTPDEKGRFCGQCAKSVIDFTAMPRADVEHYLLANADKKVCGRFNNNQIENAPVTLHIPREALYRQHSFRNMFLLALVISMGTLFFSCQKRVIGEIAMPEDTLQADTAQTTAMQKAADPNPAQCTTKTGDSLVKGNIKPVIPEGITVGMVVPEPPKPEIMGDIAIVPDTVHASKDFYTVSEIHIRPEFPGGINSLYAFITSGLELPENATGVMKMYVSFIIEKDGSLSTIKVLRGFDGNLNAEVIRKLQKSPKWVPAQINNENVRVEYILPITLKAQE